MAFMFMLSERLVVELCSPPPVATVPFNILTLLLLIITMCSRLFAVATTGSDVRSMDKKWSLRFFDIDDDGDEIFVLTRLNTSLIRPGCFLLNFSSPTDPVERIDFSLIKSNVQFRLLDGLLWPLLLLLLNSIVMSFWTLLVVFIRESEFERRLLIKQSFWIWFLFSA